MSEIASQDNVKVYEIGFHLAPFVGDENVANEVQGIKAILDRVEAVVISEDFPRLRPLAYPLSKVIKGAKSTFKECYFGWIKFEADAEKISTLNKEVEKLPNVVRYLLIKTVKENTLVGPKFAAKERMAPKKEGDKAEGEESIPEEKKEVNVAEVDKAIEELVVE